MPYLWQTETMKKRLIYLAVTAVLCIALGIASRLSVSFSEWYAVTVYPLWVAAIGRVFGLFPFSVAEILLMLLIAGGLVAFVILIVKLKKSKNYRKAVLTGSGVNLACVASTALLIFILCCGINYNRKPFLYGEDFTVEAYTQDQLWAVYIALCEEIDEVIPHIQTGEHGEFILTGDLHKTAPEAMRNLAKTYPQLDVYYPQPKPVLTSSLMADAWVAGVFSPYTIEANYNNIVLESEKAVTAIHELAHVAGFMREEEANFIAFLAARESGDPELVYSGLLNGIRWFRSEIIKRGIRSEVERNAVMPEQALHEVYRQSAFWRERRVNTTYVFDEAGEVVDVVVTKKPVADVIGEVSTAVNDGYLKTQGQEAGVESYGRMIDLVIAMYLNEE